MQGAKRQRLTRVRALATLSAALHEAVPVRVVCRRSGARCTAHGDRLFMPEDHCMCPVQDASALLSEAPWVRLNLRGVGVHVQCQSVHQVKPSASRSRVGSHCLLCVRCVHHSMEATLSTFSKHYIPIYRTTSSVPTG